MTNRPQNAPVATQADLLHVLLVVINCGLAPTQAREASSAKRSRQAIIRDSHRKKAHNLKMLILTGLSTA